MQNSDGLFPLELYNRTLQDKQSKFSGSDVGFNEGFDLIFVRNPNIQPYRYDMEILKRLKSRLIGELTLSEELSSVSKHFFTWICTEIEDDTFQLANLVGD